MTFLSVMKRVGRVWLLIRLETTDAKLNNSPENEIAVVVVVIKVVIVGCIRAYVGSSSTVV